MIAIATRKTPAFRQQTQIRKKNRSKLLLALAWVCCLLGTVLQSSPAQARTCAGSASALGVSRTVEIDATSGPGFGTAQYKRFDFLRPGEVVLTFDDGPVPRTTQKILKALLHHCAKATFFPLGKLAVTYPALMRKMISDGHTVGVHGWSHRNLPRQSLAFAISDIEKGASAIKLTTQNAVAPFFRFPYLSDSRKVIRYLAKRNFAVFSIDVDSKDYRARSSRQLVNAVMAKLRARGKGILLFHDSKIVTANALPQLLNRLKSGGYKIVHVIAKDHTKTLAKYDQRMRKLTSTRVRRVADASGRTLADVVRTISELEVALKEFKQNPEAISVTEANRLLSTAELTDTDVPPASTLSSLDKLLSGRQEHHLRMNKELGRTRIKLQIKLAKLAKDSLQFDTALQRYRQARDLLGRDFDADLTRKILAGLRSTHVKRIQTEPDAIAASLLLGKMERDGFEPSADEHDVIVSKATTYVQAIELVQRMQRAEFVPGPQASNRLIVLAPNFEAARKWAIKAKHRGHKLTGAAYEAIVGHTKTFAQAKRWLGAMRAVGHRPTDRMLADLLSRAGSYLAARRMLADMQNIGFRPSLAVHAGLDPKFMDLDDWHGLYAFQVLTEDSITADSTKAKSAESKTAKGTRKRSTRTARHKARHKARSRRTAKRAGKRKARKVAGLKKRSKRFKRNTTKRKRLKRKAVLQHKAANKRKLVKRKRRTSKTAFKRKISKRTLSKAKAFPRQRIKRTQKRRIVSRNLGKRAFRKREGHATRLNQATAKKRRKRKSGRKKR